MSHGGKRKQREVIVIDDSSDDDEVIVLDTKPPPRVLKTAPAPRNRAPTSSAPRPTEQYRRRRPSGAGSRKPTKVLPSSPSHPPKDEGHFAPAKTSVPPLASNLPATKTGNRKRETNSPPPPPKTKPQHAQKEAQEDKKTIATKVTPTKRQRSNNTASSVDPTENTHDTLPHAPPPREPDTASSRAMDDHEVLVPARLDRYTLDDFMEQWESAEIDMGLCCEELEESRAIRAANSKLHASDSTTQGRAQYGRLLFGATERLFDIMELNSQQDVFLDIGHGIGNTVLQAAYTRQCHARGMEVVLDRHVVALAYESKLQQLRSLALLRDNVEYEIGPIEWRNASLTDMQHADFLTQPPAGRRTIKAFCNNFSGAFKDRSCFGAGTMVYLDNYNAGLFCRMPPGSILITTDPLNLPPCRSTVHNHQTNAGATELSSNASFYKMETVELCPAKEAVTWTSGSNERVFVVFKYTRLSQDSTTAVFECWNPKCVHFQQPIHAQQSIVHPKTQEVGVIARTSCPHPNCNVTDRGLRSRARPNKRKDYSKLGKYTDEDTVGEWV